jgi:hypothetical protein
MDNAMRYGICEVCGMPREPYFKQWTNSKGKTVMQSGIGYPCGHAEEAWELLRELESNRESGTE